MALPASGQISMSQVNVELSKSATAQVALGDAAVRALAGVPAGAISLDNLHGKSSAVSVDYIVIGGGGYNGNGNVGGGNVRTGTYAVSTSLTMTVGSVGGSSSAFGVTATAGQNGSNAGQVHWGWDPSTNCDAWPGGPGGGLNGAAGTPGGGPTAEPYNAIGGYGGNGITWAINGVAYAGGQGGYRDGAGGGYNGANGAGWGNFGGGAKAGGIIVSYVSATQLLNGGTVTTSGGRYYHTFSTTGTLSKL